MKNESVKKWMEFIEKNPELYRELVEKKKKCSNNSNNEDALHKFIEKELIPSARKRGFNFNVDDVIDYRNNMMKIMNEEKLTKASDSKNGLKIGVGFGLLAVALLSTLPIAGLFTDRKKLNDSIEYNMSMTEKVNNDKTKSKCADNNSDILDGFHEKLSNKDSQTPYSDEWFGGPGGESDNTKGHNDKFDNSHKKSSATKEITQNNKNHSDDLVEKLQTENARLQQQLNSQRNENKRLSDENATLKTQINNKDKQIAEVNQENTYLQKKITKTSTTNAVVKSENNKITSTDADLEGLPLSAEDKEFIKQMNSDDLQTLKIRITLRENKLKINNKIDQTFSSTPDSSFTFTGKKSFDFYGDQAAMNKFNNRFAYSINSLIEKTATVIVNQSNFIIGNNATTLSNPVEMCMLISARQATANDVKTDTIKKFNKQVEEFGANDQTLLKEFANCLSKSLQQETVREILSNYITTIYNFIISSVNEIPEIKNYNDACNKYNNALAALKTTESSGLTTNADIEKLKEATKLKNEKTITLKTNYNQIKNNIRINTLKQFETMYNQVSYNFFHNNINAAIHKKIDETREFLEIKDCVLSYIFNDDSFPINLTLDQEKKVNRCKQKINDILDEMKHNEPKIISALEHEKEKKLTKEDITLLNQMRHSLANASEIISLPEKATEHETLIQKKVIRAQLQHLSNDKYDDIGINQKDFESTKNDAIKKSLDSFNTYFHNLDDTINNDNIIENTNSTNVTREYIQSLYDKIQEQIKEQKEIINTNKKNMDFDDKKPTINRITYTKINNPSDKIKKEAEKTLEEAIEHTAELNRLVSENDDDAPPAPPPIPLNLL